MVENMVVDHNRCYCSYLGRLPWHHSVQLSTELSPMDCG